MTSRKRTTSVATRTEVRKVYNLTVEGLHTFYAFAGATPLLVHNSSPCEELLKRAPAIAKIAANDASKIFIKDKHLLPDRRTYTKFNVNTVDEARALVLEGLNKPGIVFHKYKDDRFLAFVGMGRPIGENGRQIIKMVIADNGKVITVYPAHTIPPA